MAQDRDGVSIMNPDVVWTSSNESVASVNAEGLVTARRTGSATITASLDSLNASAEIEVLLPPHRITLTPSSIRFDALGATQLLSVEVFDLHEELLKDAPVSWSSDDPSVAAVDPNGTVTAVNAGMTRIAARSGNVTGYAEVTVNLDRQALTALYHATDGPNWNRSDNWLNDGALDEWFGVSTGPDGTVEDLSLERNNLTGPVPDELYGLKGLKTFRAFGNQLVGMLSPEVGGLTELELLHLASNGLTGTIPAELGNLDNLRWLELHGNSLSGMLPPQLGDMARLSSLAIGNNDIEGQIPSELGNLSNLRIFTANETRLSGPLPDTFTKLENLETLWLQGTRVCAPSNDEFAVWLNRIRFALVSPCDNPDEAALVELYHATDGPNWKARTNWLTDKPLQEWMGVAVDRYGRVDHLILGENGLSGELPPSLGDLEFLKVLHLDRNALHGKIPPELGSLRNLEGMYLSGNKLDGSIPPELGGLVNLLYLKLDENDLDGTIPLALSELGRLQELYLQKNRLSGEIPTELGQMSSLKVLNMGRNLLSGELPPGLGSLSNLSELILSGNEGLTGVLPHALISLDLAVFLAEKNGIVPARGSGLRVVGPGLSPCAHRTLRQFGGNGADGISHPGDAIFRLSGTPGGRRSGPAARVHDNRRGRCRRAACTRLLL